MAKVFDRVAIANRGEVAVRIIRACQELGIETILLHSEVDVNTKAFRMSDYQVCIGPAPTNMSYLNIEANINAALSMDVDAIHPGFGFLSENAEFAEACEAKRIKFIGPDPESIRLFGDKISAKKLVEQAGVPTIPGYDGNDQDIDILLAQCDQIGYPSIVKAAAGGGGRGLKIIDSADKARAAIESAQREGLSAFGSAQVFIEKYLDRAKHIELQIFGETSGKIFCLFDRECSIQRRHQKVIEEAVSARLEPELKQKMIAAAISIAEKAKYKGAGTVEFLVQDGNFYFLEMNTRLQVEHPVTELVMAVDLVKAQILTAQGQSVLWSPQDMWPRGHAIECRVYAEDAYSNGMPSTGVLGHCYWPEGPGRRFEVGFEEGDEITANYDSMIAKIVVWDESRPRALQKMLCTLKETIVFGLKTNIPYLLSILNHPEFVSGAMTTNFITQYFPAGIQGGELSKEQREIAEQLKQMLVDPLLKSQSGTSVNEERNPWIETLWEQK